MVKGYFLCRQGRPFCSEFPFGRANSPSLGWKSPLLIERVDMDITEKKMLHAVHVPTSSRACCFPCCRRQTCTETIALGCSSWTARGGCCWNTPPASTCNSHWSGLGTTWCIPTSQYQQQKQQEKQQQQQQQRRRRQHDVITTLTRRVACFMAPPLDAYTHTHGIVPAERCANDGWRGGGYAVCASLPCTVLDRSPVHMCHYVPRVCTSVHY